MNDRQTIRVDGLGILLVGLTAVLAMVFAFAVHWVPGAVPTTCDSACLDRGDLVAQNSMTAAAWGMLAVTVFSALVGVVTILFLALTLRETRQATTVAREIGEKQARAYLNITGCTVVGTRIREIADAKLTIRNTGSSPARSLHLQATIRAVALHFEGETQNIVETELLRLETTTPVHSVSGGEEATATAQFVSQDSLTDVVTRRRSTLVHVILNLRYETVFGEEDVETAVFRGVIASDHTLDAGVELRKSSH